MILRKTTTESTNNDAKAIDSPLNGFTVVAERQTGGKGRLSRSFYSPPGGLYASIILTKLPQDISQITPCVAVIIKRAIYDLFGLECGIKWVNDLYFNGKKVAGILCESTIKDGEIERVVIGFGINMYLENVPEELQQIISSLGIKGEGAKEKLLQRIIYDIANFDFSQFSLIAKEYEEACILIGKAVTVHSSKGDYDALCVGVSCDGALIVECDGTRKNITTGEVSVRLKK